MGKVKQPSGLQRRIAEGKAEPISELEREQLQQLRKIYVRRFGKEPGAPRVRETSASLWTKLRRLRDIRRTRGKTGGSA
ncbi:hypothetical protein SAMN04489806_1089 [Paramicrobacterium humi]|uniref:Uncharacterized protein n=1 Tax=Paramicrobacterium humi TaxID=640635 RepID=A0A1H4KBC5_9MICO|nr:hypothetical protein [Microbacterium humi]SEB55435.1 hypothetical protein SAMN04489806_1089 [Microbacterium humi]